MKVISDAAIDAMRDGSAIVSAAVGILCDLPVRAWGGYGDLPLAGDAYDGVGDRALVEVTGGAVGGTEQNVSLALSRIDPETLALLDASEVMGAGAVVNRLIFDGSGTQLLDARPYKRGRVDEVTTDETIGGEAVIAVQVESAARGLGRNNGRMRSDADQRLVDANDGFFKHCSYAAEKQIYFGGKTSSRAGSSFS